MNFLLCLIRAVSFGLYPFKDDLEKVANYETIELIIFDLPGERNYEEPLEVTKPQQRDI